MTEVLGTAVRAGAAAERALLISDLHVPSDGGRVVASLAAAIAAAQARDAALFVLGDLFDSYVSRAQVAVGVWRDVAARFRAATAAGLRLVVLVGNRDFLLGDEFARASGVELVHGGYRATLGGVDTLLLHGDELCQNDLPYQRAKRWLRSACVRGLARRLPLSLAHRAADRARERSRKVIHSGDQSRFLPSERAVAAAFAAGPARLVFGHIHRRAAGAFGVGRYHVLPAFDETGAGLWIDGDGAAPVAPAADGGLRALAEPPACPWSA